GLRGGTRPAVDPPPGGRKRHRDACRLARGVHPSRWWREKVGQDPPHLPCKASAMRPSLRFLAFAVVGWAGFRAATLGVLPTRFFSIEQSEAKAPPPIVQTQFPQIESVEPATPIA